MESNSNDLDNCCWNLSTTINYLERQSKYVFFSLNFNLKAGNLSRKLKEEFGTQIFFAQNENAWMKTDVFCEYLENVFPGRRKFHSLLVLDTASAHGYLRETGKN